jgi:hypothetical protein
MAAPTLLFVIGAPAVGKMTVGAEIARRTGLRLFHNHHSADLAARYFPFGSPPFGRIVGAIRRRVFEEVAASDLPGLVFTYVWAFEDPREVPTVDGYAKFFRDRGGAVFFAELEAPQAVRLERNTTPFRLAEKPFKRDLDASREQLIACDVKHRLTSDGEHDHRADWFRLDNSALSAVEAAERIITHFGLRTEPLEG